MKEIELKAKSGGKILFWLILILLADVGVFLGGIRLCTLGVLPGLLLGIVIATFAIVLVGVLICLIGLKIINPEEALVFTLFGKYTGTLRRAGFYWVNPFSIAINPAAKTILGQSADVKQAVSQNLDIYNKKISLKQMTLNNQRQKINDRLGTPIEIGVAVIWKVVDTAKAVFNVDNYKEFLSLHCDIALRKIVKIYPYDVAENIDTTGDGIPDEGSLRGSSAIVAERIKNEIQKNVEQAGIEIIDAQITYLAYSQEIAAAMLQRQQASAVIDARAKIVDGAVGMVEMALDKLEKSGKVELDDERKAAMVSNLLVVLCGSKDAQPIVNSGSLY
ncbi:MAG: SPFH domain-containing protein [Treponemataceae bacterium]